MDYAKMKVKEIDAYFDNLEIDELSGVLDDAHRDARSSVQKLVVKYRKRIQKHFDEIERIRCLSKYENTLYQRGISYIAGVDEAGRGPLAGPVFAAAVVLPPHTFIEGINDSKKLSEKKREELYDIIIEKAVSYGIASVSEREIDSMNIRNAAHKAMIEAVRALKVQPNHVLVDGDAVKGLTMPYTAIVNGDGLSISIAAASILAKVARDRVVKKLDEVYPQYGFGKHKGYGTQAHVEAIRTYGICPVHRRSFMTKILGHR